MTSYSQTDTFGISTIKSLRLHSLLASSHLNCFSCSPCLSGVPHTSAGQVLPTTVMTLQRQSSPALLPSPRHHSISPQNTLRPHFSCSSSSALPPFSVSLSYFMAVDLLLEHLASRVAQHACTRKHTGARREQGPLSVMRRWWKSERLSICSCTFEDLMSKQ